jgi:hypothetical protein
MRGPLVAFHNGKRLDRVGDCLVFTSTLDDAGEDFVVLTHRRGTTLLRLSLSTDRLTLEQHHQYLARYIEAVGFPRHGAKAVGNQSVESGRVPDDIELVFTILRMCCAIYDRTIGVRSDLPHHVRSSGGSEGADPMATLEAWKRNHSWYRKADENDDRSLRLGSWNLVALRVRPRETFPGNYFIGSAGALLSVLADTLSSYIGGSLSAAILRQSRRALHSMDTPAPIAANDALRFLQRTKLPAPSRRLADAILELHANLFDPSPLAPKQAGLGPFRVPPASLVFQTVAITEVLRALGGALPMTSEDRDRLVTGEGLRFGRFSAWSDTPLHPLKGWRAGTALPAPYKPDLVVKDNTNGGVLLVDAKLRKGDSADGLLPSSGVKDLQAYMNEYGLKKGMIIVPDWKGTGCRYEDIKGQENWIRGVALPSNDWYTSSMNLGYFITDLWNH